MAERTCLRHAVGVDTEALSRQARSVLRANSEVLSDLERSVAQRPPGSADEVRTLQAQVKDLLKYKEQCHSLRGDLTIAEERLRLAATEDKKAHASVKDILEQHEATQTRLYDRSTKLEKENGKLRTRILELTCEVDALGNDNGRLAQINANLTKEAYALQRAMHAQKTRSELVRREGTDSESRYRKELAAARRETEDMRVEVHEWTHKYEALKAQFDARRQEELARYAEHQRLHEAEASLTAELACLKSDMKVLRETNRLLCTENAGIPELKASLLEATRAAGEVQSLRCQCDQLLESNTREKRAREELVELNQLLQCRVDEARSSAGWAATSSSDAVAKAETAVAHHKAEADVLRRRLREFEDLAATRQRDVRRKDASVDAERTAVGQMLRAVDTELRYIHTVVASATAALPRPRGAGGEDVWGPHAPPGASPPAELAGIPPPPLLPTAFEGTPVAPAPAPAADDVAPSPTGPAGATGDDVYAALLTLRGDVWGFCTRAAAVGEHSVRTARERDELVARHAGMTGQQHEVEAEMHRLRQLLEEERRQARNAQEASRRVAASLDTTEKELAAARKKNATATDDLRKVLEKACAAQRGVAPAPRIAQGDEPTRDAAGTGAPAASPPLRASQILLEGAAARDADAQRSLSPVAGGSLNTTADPDAPPQQPPAYTSGDADAGLVLEVPSLNGVDGLTFESTVFVISDYLLAAVQHGDRQRRVIDGLRARVRELQDALHEAQRGLSLVRRETQDLLQLGDERSSADVERRVADVAAVKDAEISQLRFDVDKLRHQLEQARTEGAHFESEAHSLRHEVHMLDLRCRALTSEVDRSAEYLAAKTKELAEQNATLTEKHTAAMIDNGKQAETLRRADASLVLLARALVPYRTRYQTLVDQRNLLHREARSLATLSSRLAAALAATPDGAAAVAGLHDTIGRGAAPRINFHAAAIAVLTTIRLARATPQYAVARTRGGGVVYLLREDPVGVDVGTTGRDGRVLPYPPVLAAGNTGSTEGDSDAEAPAAVVSWAQQAQGVGDTLAALFASTRGDVGVRRRSSTPFLPSPQLPLPRRSSSNAAPAAPGGFTPATRGIAACLLALRRAPGAGTTSLVRLAARDTPSAADSDGFAGWLWNWGWVGAVLERAHKHAQQQQLGQLPPGRAARDDVGDAAKAAPVAAASSTSPRSVRREDYDTAVQKLKRTETALQAKADESRQLTELMSSKVSAATGRGAAQRGAAGGSGTRPVNTDNSGDGPKVTDSGIPREEYEKVLRKLKRAENALQAKKDESRQLTELMASKVTAAMASTSELTVSESVDATRSAAAKRVACTSTAAAAATSVVSSRGAAGEATTTVRTTGSRATLRGVGGTFWDELASDADGGSVAGGAAMLPLSLRAQGAAGTNNTSTASATSGSEAGVPPALVFPSAGVVPPPPPRRILSHVSLPSETETVSSSPTPSRRSPRRGDHPAARLTARRAPGSTTHPRAHARHVPPATATSEVLAYISALDAKVDSTLRHSRMAVDLTSTPSNTLPLDRSTLSTGARETRPGQ